MRLASQLLKQIFVELSWFKKLLLAAYIFSVIAISIQLTAKSSNQVVRKPQKTTENYAKSSELKNQSSIQIVNYRN